MMKMTSFFIITLMNFNSISEFEYGLGYSKNINVSFLKNNIKRIKGALKYMDENKEYRVFGELKDIIFKLFDFMILPTFIELCTSRDCDAKTKEGIINLLTIGARGFNEIGREDYEKGLIDAAENFKTNGKFTEKDISIFKEINRFILKTDVELMNLAGDF